MVVRSGTGAARILDNERWVAPLGDELRAALSSALVEQLGARNVTGLPRPSNQTVMSIRTQVRASMRGPGAWPSSKRIGSSACSRTRRARQAAHFVQHAAQRGGARRLRGHGAGATAHDRAVRHADREHRAQLRQRAPCLSRRFVNRSAREPSMGAREGIRLWEPATLKRCMTRDVLRAPPVSARRAPVQCRNARWNALGSSKPMSAPIAAIVSGVSVSRWIAMSRRSSS